MRKLLLILILLSGCMSAEESQKKIKQIKAQRVSDGIHFKEIEGVQCVIFQEFNKGGITCNWEKYNKENFK